MDPVPGAAPTPIHLAAVADYDPKRKNIFLHGRKNFWAYNYDKNEYTKLNSDIETSISTNAVIDPNRRLPLIVGGTEHDTPGMFAISIAPGSNYRLQDWSSQVRGCDGLKGAGESDYPGLACNPAQDRILGSVNSGDTNSLYTFDPDTRACTTQTFTGDPKLKPETRGVFGLWRYFPS